MQSHGRWIDLLGQFQGFVVEVNRAAGRTVLRVENSPVTCLEIEREDGTALSVRYDSALYRVVCSGSFGAANCEYELKALPVEGNDAVVWVDRLTRKTRADKEIAELLLRTLLLAPVHA